MYKCTLQRTKINAIAMLALLVVIYLSGFFPSKERRDLAQFGGQGLLAGSINKKQTDLKEEFGDEREDGDERYGGDKEEDGHTDVDEEEEDNDDDDDEKESDIKDEGEDGEEKEVEALGKEAEKEEEHDDEIDSNFH